MNKYGKCYFESALSSFKYMYIIFLSIKEGMQRKRVTLFLFILCSDTSSKILAIVAPHSCYKITVKVGMHPLTLGNVVRFQRCKLVLSALQFTETQRDYILKEMGICWRLIVTLLGPSYCTMCLKKKRQCEAKRCNFCGKQIITKGFSFVSVFKRRQRVLNQVKVYYMN